MKEITSGATLGSLVEMYPYGQLVPGNQGAKKTFVFPGTYGYYGDASERHDVFERSLPKNGQGEARCSALVRALGYMTRLTLLLPLLVLILGCSPEPAKPAQMALDVRRSKTVNPTSLMRIPASRPFLADITKSGHFIAVPTDSKEVFLISEKSGAWRIAWRLVHQQNASRAVFSDDGAYVVTHDNQHVYLWSTGRGPLLDSVPIHKITGIRDRPIDELCAGPNPGQLTVYCEYAGCSLLQIQNGVITIGKRTAWPSGGRNKKIQLRSAAPSTTLCFYQGSTTVEVYDWSTDSARVLSPIAEPIVAGAFGGGRAISLSSAGGLYTLDVSKSRQWVQVAAGIASAPFCLSGLRFDSESQYLSVRSGSEAYLFDLNGREVAMRTSISQEGMSLLSRPNGSGLILVPYGTNELMNCGAP